MAIMDGVQKITISNAADIENYPQIPVFGLYGKFSARSDLAMLSERSSFLERMRAFTSTRDLTG